MLAVGACIENLLLMAEGCGISACWLGEILNRKDDVNRSLNISSRYELMAVIALGYGSESPRSDRKPLSELLI